MNWFLQIHGSPEGLVSSDCKYSSFSPWAFIHHSIHLSTLFLIYIIRIVIGLFSSSVLVIFQRALWPYSCGLLSVHFDLWFSGIAMLGQLSARQWESFIFKRKSRGRLRWRMENGAVDTRETEVGRAISLTYHYCTVWLLRILYDSW